MNFSKIKQSQTANKDARVFKTFAGQNLKKIFWTAFVAEKMLHVDCSFLKSRNRKRRTIKLTNILKLMSHQGDDITEISILNL